MKLLAGYWNDKQAESNQIKAKSIEVTGIESNRSEWILCSWLPENCEKNQNDEDD